jgi:hypothetical protein
MNNETYSKQYITMSRFPVTIKVPQFTSIGSIYDPRSLMEVYHFCNIILFPFPFIFTIISQLVSDYA